MTTEASDAPGKLNVLLVDFTPVIQAGLKSILIGDERICLVGNAVDVSGALKTLSVCAADGRSVDVVLMEARTDTFDGIGAITEIARSYPSVRVIVITEHHTDSLMVDAIVAGASAYLLFSHTRPERLLQSIRLVGEGEMVMTAQLFRNALKILAERDPRTAAERVADAARLTAREIEVLRLMAGGDSNKAIAGKLDVTTDTVKKHVRRVIEKLKAGNRTQASIIAAKAGIADISR